MRAVLSHPPNPPAYGLVYYVSIGNSVYRQCVGILMGTDCAPRLENLFLFHYEYKYMRNLIKMNLMLAKKLNNTMQYIDDIE